MNARTPRDLGLLIRDRRRALHLRQHELAERVGASRQWIIAVEQGKSRAELGLVLRTLAALELELAVYPVGSAPASTREHPSPLSSLPPLDMTALIDQILNP